MQQLNIHQQKLYSIIEAALAMLGLCLTWYTAGIEGYPQADKPQNGFEDWGWLTLIGVGVVVIMSLMGDKTKAYDANTKKIVIVAFLAISLGAALTFFRLQASTGQQQIQGYIVNAKATAGPGLWICLMAGIIGMAWVSGVLSKLSTPAAAPPNTPSPAAPASNNPPAA